MSSVIVTWKGRCPDRERQDHLLGYVEHLARLHGERRERSCLRLSEPADTLKRERARGLPEDPPIRRLDREISGRIALCSDVQFDQEYLAREIARHGLRANREAPPGDRHYHVFPSRVHVRGVDFQVYDPRGLYPGEDRFSCVFMNCPEAPFLDGALVKVSGPEWCSRIRDETLRGTQWYLQCPLLHLRDYLDDWIDLTLSWLREYFIPSLNYSHREILRGFDELYEGFMRLEQAVGREAACERLFEELCRGFSEEADFWEYTLPGGPSPASSARTGPETGA